MNQMLRPGYGGSRGGQALTPTFFGAAILLATALLLGGASRLNAIPLVIVELVSIPVLIWGLARIFEGGAWRDVKVLLLLILGAALIPLLQLIPLPSDVWTSLPGRGPAATVATLAGLGQAYQPFSLTPHETLKSALALLPPAAMLLITLSLRSRERMLLLALALVIVALNLAFGVGQIVGGDSPLFVYENSSRGFSVGLFANRNHYAILLVASLPMAALWLLALRARSRETHLVIVVAALMVLLLVVIGVIMGGSRAAIGLLIPTMIASGFIVWHLRARLSNLMTISIFGVVVVAVAVALFAGLPQLLARFGADALKDIRFAAAPEIYRQAVAHLPFGSGVGSFEMIYQSAEPVRLMSDEFLNHAHDDYLELFLETGLAGLVLVGLFLLWWLGKVFRTIRAIGPYGDLARAGAIITGTLLLHSLVDYPLRTSALATLFAFAVALLATPEPLGRRREATAAAKLPKTYNALH